MEIWCALLYSPDYSLEMFANVTAHIIKSAAISVIVIDLVSTIAFE